ncbi:MAG TPA: hypothetical protein VNL74_00410 [Methylococcus sp.]|nr:hypothetical protein [Methylococcus sp.]
MAHLWERVPTADGSFIPGQTGSGSKHRGVEQGMVPTLAVQTTICRIVASMRKIKKLKHEYATLNKN